MGKGKPRRGASVARPRGAAARADEARKVRQTLGIGEYAPDPNAPAPRPSKSERRAARKNPQALAPAPKYVSVNPNLGGQFRASDTARGVGGYGPGSGPMRPDGSWLY